MRYFLFLISLILLSSTLYFQEIGVLYRFSAGDKIHEWKHFGNQGKDPKFMGEINDGSPDGYGIEINPDGFIYKGKFREGKWDGKGTFYFRLQNSSYITVSLLSLTGCLNLQRQPLKASKKLLCSLRLM